MEYVEEAYPSQGYSLLPDDAVKRAFMRLGTAHVEAVGGAWYAIVVKKAYVEEDFKNVREKLQKIEDFIGTHGNESSPFALGTENPTQLDVHIYVHVERIRMFKDSAYDEWY